MPWPTRIWQVILHIFLYAYMIVWFLKHTKSTFWTCFVIQLRKVIQILSKPILDKWYGDAIRWCKASVAIFTCKLILFSYPIACCRKCFSVESLLISVSYIQPSIIFANCSYASNVFFPFSCDITYLNHITKWNTILLMTNCFWMQIRWNPTPLP